MLDFTAGMLIKHATEVVEVGQIIKAKEIAELLGDMIDDGLEVAEDIEETQLAGRFKRFVIRHKLLLNHLLEMGVNEFEDVVLTNVELLSEGTFQDGDEAVISKVGGGLSWDPSAL